MVYLSGILLVWKSIITYMISNGNTGIYNLWNMEQITLGFYNDLSVMKKEIQLSLSVLRGSAMITCAFNPIGKSVCYFR